MSVVDLKRRAAVPLAPPPALAGGAAALLPAGATRRKTAPARTLRRALETVVTWTERARMRRRLLTLDDRMLQDIGITRADVHGEAEKPFWRV